MSLKRKVEKKTVLRDKTEEKTEESNVEIESCVL